MKLLAFASLAALASASPLASPNSHTVEKREYPTKNASAVVDLGYAIYQGVPNTTTGITSWLGMRYAASTEGKNRWQPPQHPETDRSEVKQANAIPQRCPQGSNSPPPANPDFLGSEDCLFLNVQAPIGATHKSKLPVHVTIHGGGYGQGRAGQDLTLLMNANNNNFVGVIIQYRLAAFGFLSSAEVHRHGTPNAGILDQEFALRWVQQYVHPFGGDPRRVTITGESAGGGSVMLQAMLHGGTQGTKLFSNAITASPYLPLQYGYADGPPTQAYNDFAARAGCAEGSDNTTSVFECLVGKDTLTLQEASQFVSSSGFFGSWAFVPVTDGRFVRERPTTQLLRQRRVNGARMLTGNNANEGPGFVPQNLTTLAALTDYLHGLFPLLSDAQVQQVLERYPAPDTPDDPAAVKFATAGDDGGATAVNVSTYAVGHQQRANNIYSETIFTCPSYWLAEAFSTNGRKAYKYQFSVIGASHGEDVAGYFGPTPAYLSPEFEKAFQNIWGNFIAADNPSIPSAEANGEASNTTANAAAHWPLWKDGSHVMINLNETGGTPYLTFSAVKGRNITQFEEPGLQNAIRAVDADAWEGGRGARCAFWAVLGALVPEK